MTYEVIYIVYHVLFYFVFFFSFFTLPFRLLFTIIKIMIRVIFPFTYRTYFYTTRYLPLYNYLSEKFYKMVYLRYRYFIKFLVKSYRLYRQSRWKHYMFVFRTVSIDIMMVIVIVFQIRGIFRLVRNSLAYCAFYTEWYIRLVILPFYIKPLYIPFYTIIVPTLWSLYLGDNRLFCRFLFLTFVFSLDYMFLFTVFSDLVQNGPVMLFLFIYRLYTPETLFRVSLFMYSELLCYLHNLTDFRIFFFNFLLLFIFCILLILPY